MKVGGVDLKDVAISVGVGWLIGKYLQGVDGKKMMADSKTSEPKTFLGRSTKSYGVGGVIAAAGLAVAVAVPPLRTVGVAAIAGGALMSGMRLSLSADQQKASGFVVAGPSLADLAAQDVAGDGYDGYDD